MILQSDLSKNSSKVHEIRLVAISMFQTCTHGMTDVDMVQQSRLRNSVCEIMGLIADYIFRFSPVLLNGLFNLLLDVVSFKAAAGFHADNRNVLMLKRMSGMFGGNAQNQKKFLPIDHNTFVNDIRKLFICRFIIIFVSG